MHPTLPLFNAALTADLIAERTLRLGTSLTVLRQTTSTNDLGLQAARSGGPHGATFVAEEQTRGRGRQGRVWTSPPGQGLTFSVLLRLTAPIERVSGLPLMVGLSVREAVAHRVVQPTGIKWPNDIVCQHQKLAGILVESLVRGDELEAVVVGIGVNVHLPVPENLPVPATSLARLGAEQLGREKLLVDVLETLEYRLPKFETAGLAPFLDELEKYNVLRGHRVRVGELEGRAEAIAPSGALFVLADDGRQHRIHAGTVQIVP
ncbi:biotin--[acetyl-CoA-carboxylase] ligase [Myxococcota bacterium]